MKKRIFAAALVCAVLLAALSGCTIHIGGGSESAPASTQSQSSSQAAGGADTATSAPASAGQTTGGITEDEAKGIALEHAKVNEADLTGLRIRQERDDGVDIYDVEFYAGNREYDYEIRISDGQILQSDSDIEDDFYTSMASAAAYPEADARAAALARVRGAAEQDISMHLEQDDGRLIYEGKIVYEQMEYDFEIDAGTGDFISWEQESVFD